jgi:sugar-specific transcriptional regulator TrmB
MKTQTNPLTLYEQDYYLWLGKTVQLLKEGNYSAIDIENLIEEIDDIRKNEQETIQRSLRTIFMYLLKLKYQPQNPIDHCRSSLVKYRKKIQDILDDSPSLKTYMAEIFEESYQDGRELAKAETGLKIETFPVVCPFTLEETLNRKYLPHC